MISIHLMKDKTCCSLCSGFQTKKTKTRCIFFVQAPVEAPAASPLEKPAASPPKESAASAAESTASVCAKPKYCIIEGETCKELRGLAISDDNCQYSKCIHIHLMQWWESQNAMLFTVPWC